MSINKEIVEILNNSEDIQEESFNDILDEINKSLIKEAVVHFTRFRPRSYDDDSRFFYNKSELSAFYNAFKDAGGDIKALIQSVVLDDNNEFFCWEIKRDKEYIKKARLANT